VWSEKGTVRGVLQPVLDECIGFRVMHGFGSATIINDVSRDDDGHPLTVLYIGDYDPSGIWMSERDIPERLSRYGGNHISTRLIALLHGDCVSLGRRPAFNVKDKKKDPRAPWFRSTYGQLCWELDAMDPNDLRSRVANEIIRHSNPNHGNVVGSSTRRSANLCATFWTSGSNHDRALPPQRTSHHSPLSLRSDEMSE
jgi:hypothetical protein